jgi:FtsH-binding integral membrane protein
MASTVPLMMDVEGQEDSGHEDSAIKNDFAYNNNVAGSAKHIRMGFLRKVYGLLSLQLLLTTLIAGVCLFTPKLKELIHANPWLILVAFVASLGLLVALHIKRRQTPVNFFLLAAFTVVEAYTVGVIVTFYDVSVVIQAFFLTSAVVVGLTAFTFQTKKDFSGWGMGLFAGLWILILGGFMQMFVGGEATDLGLAILGAVIFSGFIIFDTQMIMTRVSPEDYIIATIELYLDIINLFIEILKILDKVNRK